MIKHKAEFFIYCSLFLCFFKIWNIALQIMYILHRTCFIGPLISVINLRQYLLLEYRVGKGWVSHKGGFSLWYGQVWMWQWYSVQCMRMQYICTVQTSYSWQQYHRYDILYLSHLLVIAQYGPRVCNWENRKLDLFWDMRSESCTLIGHYD